MRSSITWKPSKQDYLMTVMEQNPWHQTDSVPSRLAPPKVRPLVNWLFAELQNKEPAPHSLILGPRSVGKATVMYQTIRRLIDVGVAPAKLWWIGIDHPLMMDTPLDYLVKPLIGDASSQDSSLPILFLNELMYAKDWDKWLKSFYDDRWPVRIVATSSVTTASKHQSKSGIRCWHEYPLRPCLLGEYLQLSGIDVSLEADEDLLLSLQSMRAADLPQTSMLIEKRNELLCTGGFPRLLLARQDDDQESFLRWVQSRLRSDAVERVLYKDITRSFSVGRPRSMEHLLCVLAGMLTDLISSGTITSQFDITQLTSDRYISYLEKAFLIFALPNYSGNKEVTKHRGRKLYFTDGAVRNAVLRRSFGVLSRTPEIGLLYENMLASHLQALAVQENIGLYHWRDGQYEVDFVYDHPDRPLAFGVAAPVKHKQKALLKLMRRYPKFRGGCYLVDENTSLMSRPEHAQNGIGIIPLDWLLMAISKQMEAALAHAFRH